MRTPLFALVLGAALACSSSTPPVGTSPGDAGATADGGVQGGPGDATGPAASNQCGAAPFITLGITVTGQPSGATPGAPIAGARFTSPLCPDAFAVSDADGKMTGLISRGAAFYGRFDASTYVKLLTPEQRYLADDTAVVEMVPELFTTLVLSGYDPTKATIFIGATADGATGACASFDGIRFAIQGHPEWVPTYYSAAAVPAAVAGDVTTASGRASFAGVDVGEPVVLVGTKAGCDITFAHGVDTGRAPREAGYVTFIGAYPHDLGGAVDAGTD